MAQSKELVKSTVELKPQLGLKNSPDDVYVGISGDWVHLVYNDKSAIEKAVLELKKEKGIDRAYVNNVLVEADKRTPINISVYDKTYPAELQGRNYCRIHKNEFESKFEIKLDDLKGRPQDAQSTQSSESSGCRLM